MCIVHGRFLCHYFASLSVSEIRCVSEFRSKNPLSDFRNVRGCAFHRALVVALLIRTSDYRSVFAESLHQVLMSAIRALLRDRLRRRSEFALRIISAAVKSVALARAFFDEFTFFAFGALHADEVLLHILAFGISAARSELAETAVPIAQVA